MGCAGDRRIRAAIAATFFVHGFLFASWTAHIPHVRAHLGLSDGSLGLALLGAPVGSVLAVSVGARLLERAGSRRGLRASLAGYAVTGPLVGLSGSLVALFATLAVWGACMGVLDVAMNTQAVAEERRGARVLLPGFHGSWSLGALAGAGLGAAGVAAGIGLSAQLLVTGVPCALVAGWLALALRPDGSPPPRTRRSGLVRAPVLLLASVAFADMLCEGAAADWSAVELRSTAHAGPGVAGLGYAAFALGMVAVRLTGNRLLARAGPARLLPATAAVATAGFAVGLVAAEPAAVVAGWACLGFGLGVVVPTVFGAAGRLDGLPDGAGIAAVAAVGWTGFVCGPPLIGELASLTSLRLALVVVPVLTALIVAATATSATLRQPAVPASPLS